MTFLAAAVYGQLITVTADTRSKPVSSNHSGSNRGRRTDTSQSHRRIKWIEIWVATCAYKLDCIVIKAQLVSCHLLSSLGLSHQWVGNKPNNSTYLHKTAHCSGNPFSVSFLLWSLMSTMGRGEDHSEPRTVTSWLSVETVQQHKRNLNQLECLRKGILHMNWTTYYRNLMDMDTFVQKEIYIVFLSTVVVPDSWWMVEYVAERLEEESKERKVEDAASKFPVKKTVSVNEWINKEINTEISIECNECVSECEGAWWSPVCLGRGSLWPPGGGETISVSTSMAPYRPVCYVTGCASQQQPHFTSSSKRDGCR